MTDEHTPTPAPASNSTGCLKAGQAPPSPQGRRHDRRDDQGRPQPVDTGGSLPLGARPGDPVAEDDVRHEQPAVGGGEDETPRAAPAAARITVPPNSIAPTVDSGSRATAR